MNYNQQQQWDIVLDYAQAILHAAPEHRLIHRLSGKPRPWQSITAADCDWLGQEVKAFVERHKLYAPGTNPRYIVKRLYKLTDTQCYEWHDLMAAETQEVA
jgi:hypothetical protein